MMKRDKKCSNNVAECRYAVLPSLFFNHSILSTVSSFGSNTKKRNIESKLYECHSAWYLHGDLQYVHFVKEGVIQHGRKEPWNWNTYDDIKSTLVYYEMFYQFECQSVCRIIYSAEISRWCLYQLFSFNPFSLDTLLKPIGYDLQPILLLATLITRQRFLHFEWKECVDKHPQQDLVPTKYRRSMIGMK